MKALVVGGSGQIGGWLLETLAERGHEAVGTFASVPFNGLHHLDASDLETSSAWVRGQRPGVVFYPAGFTWVDGCERTPSKAFGANTDQPLNLARAAADSNALFVYFSTDYVFDGLNGPYDEDAATNPLSVYGASKRDAEVRLSEMLGDHVLIARTSWVYGPERQGKNFGYQLLKSLASGRTVECPSDQLSNPSYGPDVARTAVLLAEQTRSGVVHLAGPEVVDRPRFGRAIASAFGFDPALVVGKTTKELGQTTPRPLKGGLITAKLESWTPGALRGMAEALDDFRERVGDRNSPWAFPFPS